MAVYRTGFGTGAYGVEVFGLDGNIADASAVASASVSVTAAAQRIQNVSATASIVTLVETTALGYKGLGSVLSSISCIVTITATKKWEPGSNTAETWTPVANTAETWTIAA